MAKNFTQAMFHQDILTNKHYNKYPAAGSGVFNLALNWYFI